MSKTRTQLQPYMQSVDQKFLGELQRGVVPQLPEVSDLPTYLRGLIGRVGVQRGLPTVGLLVRSILSSRLMGWRFPDLIRSVNNYSTYQRAVTNTLFLNALQLLETDLVHYLHELDAYEQRIRLQDVQRDYSYTLEKDWWDVSFANDVAKDFDRILDAIQTISDLQPTEIPEGEVNLIAALNEAAPELAEFRDYYPEFLRIAQDNHILALEDSMVTIKSCNDLEIKLPKSAPTAVKRSYEKPGQIVYTEVTNAAKFEGFFIGVVLAPSSPDEPRDLDNKWTSAEECEKACDWWAFNSGVVGINHEEYPEQQGKDHPDFVLLRNWVQLGDYTVGGFTIRHGSWCQAYQCVSERAFNGVKNREFNGLSPKGRTFVVLDQPAEDQEEKE